MYQDKKIHRLTLFLSFRSHVKKLARPKLHDADGQR
jgi:hypothetical protein